MNSPRSRAPSDEQAGSVQLTEQLIEQYCPDKKLQDKHIEMREKIVAYVLEENPWQKRRPTVSPVKEVPTRLEDSF